MKKCSHVRCGSGRSRFAYVEHSASINGGKVGVLHGNKTYLLQDEHGQVRDAYSIAAGLDYPGVGRSMPIFTQQKE